MDKFGQLQTFIAVVEQGSFAAAARELQQTKAAVSRKIIVLEEYLGTQLLQRTTRRVNLTEAGECFYDRAKKTLAALEEAETTVANTNSQPKGILRVTCHRYFGSHYIVPLLSNFMDKYPKLRINLELSERFPDLAHEHIDILIGVGVEGPANLVRRRIAKVSETLSASPSYLAKHGAPQSPKELKQHHYITHTLRTPDNILVFNNNLQIIVDPILRLNDCQAIHTCALKGLGIVKLPDYMIEQDLAKDNLVEILTKYRATDKSVYVFYQQQRYLQPKIRLFLDYLYEKM